MISFAYLSPVSFLLFATILILVFGASFSKSLNAFKLYHTLQLLAIAGLIFSFILTILLLWAQFREPSIVPVFGALFKLDGFTLLSQAFLLFFSICYLTLTASFDTEFKINNYEFLVLFLLFLIGALCLVAANDFVSLYVCLELQTIPLYMLIASKRTSKIGVEAALKYFILSLFSSALLLFGIGLVYFISGCLHFSDLLVFNSLSKDFLFGTSDSMHKPYATIFSIGVGCIIISFFFKFAAAPLHFWTPDIYAGAPTSIVLLLSTLPKYSALVAFIHVFLGAFSPLAMIWTPILSSFGIISLLVGSVGAFYFDSLSRIIAFGSTAHIGFVLLALVAAGGDAAFLAFFYFLAYTLASFVFFGVWLNFKPAGVMVFVQDFTGLLSVSKFYGFLLILSLFSFAGIPPLAGFVAKLLVLKGLMLAYSTSFAILVFLLSAISAVYYLRIIKFAFFKKPGFEFNLYSLASPKLVAPLVLTSSLLVLLAFFIYL